MLHSNKVSYCLCVSYHLNHLGFPFLSLWPPAEPPSLGPFDAFAPSKPFPIIRAINTSSLDGPSSLFPILLLLALNEAVFSGSMGLASGKDGVRLSAAPNNSLFKNPPIAMSLPKLTFQLTWILAAGTSSSSSKVFVSFNNRRGGATYKSKADWQCAEKEDCMMVRMVEMVSLGRNLPWRCVPSGKLIRIWAWEYT